MNVEGILDNKNPQKTWSQNESETHMRVKSYRGVHAFVLARDSKSAMIDGAVIKSLTRRINLDFLHKNQLIKSNNTNIVTHLFA